MKELVSVMTQSGAGSVRTYIQSGNVIYSGSPESAESATVLIEKQHGFKPDVLVLDTAAFRKAVIDNPFRNAEGKTCHVAFCKSAPESVDHSRIERLKTGTESYALKGNVFYLYAPDGIGRSKLAANIEACLGVPVTARNLNTVNRLAEMVKERDQAGRSP